MSRLSRNEISELERRLARWQAPEAMSRLVERTMGQIGSAVLFNQAGLALLRDAWIAADFAQVRNADQVRLVADNWPDFEIKIDGRMEVFEAVEAGDPERRRGEEYRRGINRDDEEKDWIARAEQAPAWLEAACRKKTNKRYSKQVSLVVYLNLSEFGIRQREIESCFSSATTVAKQSFDEVWVLWKKQAYLVWKGGKALSV